LEQLITASGNTTVEQRALKGPWNAPVLAVQKIEAVRDALIHVDPKNAEYYKENAEKAIADIHTMSDTIKGTADSLEVENIPVMCMEWQQYLVEWMGFTIVRTYSPPETLSLKDVNDLIKTGRENGVRLVIDNLQSGTDVGAEIAASIGAEHVVLTNFPNAVPETDTLAAMIAYNANQLFNAVQCQKNQDTQELEFALQKEVSKRQVYQVIAAVLFVVCLVESVVIYVRQ
jgi:ABC-type Zn uptake system ZnuABC Zn-binding protein ZnuA